MNQREIVILSGVRTPVADFGGSFKAVPPTELATKVVAEAVQRSGVKGDDIGHCVLGNVAHTDRKDLYISRVALLRAGLPIEVPAMTVNRLCGSGLQAVVSATQMLLLGDCDVAIAGGVESMTRVPYWVPTARFGNKMGNTEMVDPMTGALTCPMNDYHMGITAENVAEKYGITREQQDELAATSHQRAEHAQKNGYFKSQILPIEVTSRKGTTLIETDEHIRFDCTAESMASLRPYFKKDGTVTAANAAGINDGAAAMILADKAFAESKGLKPMARVAGYSVVGVDPAIMGIGPVSAVNQLLEKSGVGKDEVGVWEN